MYQIIASKNNINPVYRFDGKIIYLKVNNMTYANQLIAQIQMKGGKVQRGRNWLKLDIIGSNEKIKLGNKILYINNMAEHEIEMDFVEFIHATLKTAGFEIKYIGEI